MHISPPSGSVELTVGFGSHQRNWASFAQSTFLEVIISLGHWYFDCVCTDADDWKVRYWLKKSVWAMAEFQTGILKQWQTLGCFWGRAQFAVLKKRYWVKLNIFIKIKMIKIIVLLIKINLLSQGDSLARIQELCFLRVFWCFPSHLAEPRRFPPTLPTSASLHLRTWRACTLMDAASKHEWH